MNPNVKPIDYSCSKCGAECPIAPEPPARAICENCCGYHEYKYDPHRRGKFCTTCDHEQPYDYYYD